MTAITKSISLWALAALVFLVCGCGMNPSSAYVGTWVGHRRVNPVPGASLGLLNTASLVQLTIKQSGTFDLLDSGMPKSGQYQQFSNYGILTVDTIANQPMARQSAQAQANNLPIRVTLQKNGTLIFIDPKEFDPEGLVLTRSAPESQ